MYISYQCLRKPFFWAFPERLPKSLLISLILGLTACQTSSNSPKEVSESAADDATTSLSMAASYLDGGRPDKALAEIQAVLDKDPNHIEALNLMGLAQLALSNPKRAVVFLDKAWKLKPLTAFAVNLSSVYIELARYKDAEKIIATILQRKETPPYAHRERIYHNYGLIADKTGRGLLSEKMFKKATEENPMFYLSHMQLARIYREKSKPALVIKALEAARFGCPSCYEPLEALVQIYRSQGNDSLAKHLIQDYKLNESLTQNDRRRIADLEGRLAKNARRENQDSPNKSR